MVVIKNRAYFMLKNVLLVETLKLLKNQYKIICRVEPFHVSAYQSSHTMIQKSLLSFFKTVNDKPSYGEPTTNGNNGKQHETTPEKFKKELGDSPVLKKKRSCIAVLESDSEEEDARKLKSKRLCTETSVTKKMNSTKTERDAISTEVDKEDSRVLQTEGNEKLEPQRETSSPLNTTDLKRDARTPDYSSKKSRSTEEKIKINMGKLSKILKRKSTFKKNTLKKKATTGTLESKYSKQLPSCLQSKNEKEKEMYTESLPERCTSYEENEDSDETSTPKQSKSDRKKRKNSGKPSADKRESDLGNKKYFKKKSSTKQVKEENAVTKDSQAKNILQLEDLTKVIWKYGVKTPYLNLAKTLQNVEETSSRLKIIDILSEYFRNTIMYNKDDLLFSIYLCLGTLRPAYESVELGIAETYLMKAIAQCTGRTLTQIKSDVAKTGDLGIVAEHSRSNQKLMFQPAPLTVQGVYNQLHDIALISGNNAMQKKIDKIQALFVACRECEARFLIRSLLGKMRIGLAEQSVIQSLALACTTTPPNQKYPFEVTDVSKTMSSDEFKKRVSEDLLILKTTYCECPNYNLIVPVLLKDGFKSLLEKCKITPGIPVKPMLAQPSKGVQEVLQRFEGIRFTCEWKYDGERVQIHVLEDSTVKIYSRNQEDHTSKYPDIIVDVRKALKPVVKSCILDAEAVAWDTEQKKIMPFQILSTRKRKDAQVDEIKVRVCVFLFDLLYLNGESLTAKALAERRDRLKEHIIEFEEKFAYVKSIDTNTMEEVQECLEESVKGNCEGLMVKTLDTEATYEIAKRSRNWLKLKKDYLEGCGDTLDLVVIGGYIGKGKRAGQYGGFLLASYNPETEEYQTICKIGTGFSEEALATHSEFLKNHIIPNARPYYRYDPSHEPDQWFDAVQVWEVKCADLSLSPIYFCAIGLIDQEKGISLRFPRFLRVRDKTVEDATSSQQVAEMYQNQDQIKNNAVETNFNEEYF